MLRSGREARWAVLLGGLMCLWGCTTGGSSVETRQAALETIRLQPEVLEEGAVGLRLHNGTSRLIGANLCRARVEIQGSEGAWEEVEVPLEKECVDRHEALGPGSEKAARFVSAQWPEEELRFSLSVEYPMGIGFETIRSPGFRVEVTAPAEEPEEAEEAEEAEDELTPGETPPE